MNVLFSALLLACLHGGQYLPPAPDPGAPAPTDGLVAQPGLGPTLPYAASRWEWWFDFNHEPLLALRQRAPLRAFTAGGSPWRSVSDDDRGSTVLPALVEAVRRVGPVVSGIRREFNSRDVRAAAVLGLGRLRRSDAVPYIELVVEDDPDLFVRTQAILALGFSESPQATETLTRIFRDEDAGAELRSYAIASLGLVGSPEAIDVIAAALDEKSLKAANNQVRAAIVYAAGLSGSSLLGDRLRALEPTWLYEKEPQLRALVAVALGRIGDPASVPFLIAALDDPDNQVRRSVATGLEGTSAPLDPPSVQRLIAQYERDADAPTRVNLVRAIGNARTPESRAWLRAALPASTYEYRPHLALALALDGDPDSGPLLLEGLARSNEESLRGAFALALGLLGTQEAVEPLLALLEEQKSPMLRGYLCLALGLLQPAQGMLAARLDAFAREESDVELIRSAILGLGLLGERDRLAQLASDVVGWTRIVPKAAVLHGLGLVGDAGAIAPLLAIHRDETQPVYVRAYALQALSELTDPRSLSPAWRLSSHAEMSHDVGFLFELYRVL